MIWVTLGQEMYRSLFQSFYRMASLIVIIYGINNELSFKSLDIWLNEAKRFCPDEKFF